jgi:Zn-dependent protease with chaperone function
VDSRFYSLCIVFDISGLIRFARNAVMALALSPVASTASYAAPDELKLPNLGESSTSMFSSQFEYQLGRAWLREFRSQVPTVDDPLLFDYLENLIYKLVNHSKLEDRRIDLVIVDNPTLNAFAVPGGVIGIHNGLFLWAESEDELATVLAHEIAHLSQRHFSRGVEFQQKLQPVALAAMLASLVLMATAGGNAGMAARCNTAVVTSRKLTGLGCKPLWTLIWIRRLLLRCLSGCCMQHAIPGMTRCLNSCAPTHCLKIVSRIRAIVPGSIRRRRASQIWNTS